MTYALDIIQANKFIILLAQHIQQNNNPFDYSHIETNKLIEMVHQGIGLLPYGHPDNVADNLAAMPEDNQAAANAATSGNAAGGAAASLTPGQNPEPSYSAVVDSNLQMASKALEGIQRMQMQEQQPQQQQVVVGSPLSASSYLAGGFMWSYE